MSGSRGKGTKLPPSQVIAQLTKVKTNSRIATPFKKKISELKEAISKNNMDVIKTHLNYFEKELNSSLMFDQKDLAVKEANISIDETKEKFGLKQKSRTSEKGLPPEGLKGTGVSQPGNKASLDSSTWLTECIGKIANWLKNTNDEVLQISFSDCPEKSKSVQQELSFIKGELERRDNVRKTERTQLSSTLKELHSALKQTDENAQDQKKIVTSTSDPDAKVVTDIKNLFIDVCQRNQLIKQKPEEKQKEQGHDLRNNETLERQIVNIVQNINERDYNESDKDFQNPLDHNVRTIRDTLRRQSTIAEERMALVRLYENEINKLQEEVGLCSYDTAGVGTRMKEANRRMTDALISIRRTLEKRISREETELESIRLEISTFSEELGECEQKKPGNPEMRDLAGGIKALRHSMKQKGYFTNPNKENEHARLEITRLKQVLKEKMEENEHLVLRLSKVASAALSDNNPNIADLSDPNRPTKIGEKYKEIYDTEWTDAYECFHIKKGQDERKICSTLVNILEEAETYCTRLARLQQKQILVLLFKPNDPKATPSKKTSEETDGTVLEAIHSKMISDLRKQTSHKSVEYVMKSFFQQVNIPQKDREPFKKYVYKCTEICWFMSLQTPPVVLGKLGKKEAKFDKDKYAEYTKKGSKIDFVTWPPLLLYEGGSLLCKGVAQGKD